MICLRDSFVYCQLNALHSIGNQDNGWIKEELYVDRLIEVIRACVNYYNEKRPSYDIGYDTPDNYYKRYIHGELEHKDTFSKRVLSPEPKFVKNKRTKVGKQSISEMVSTGRKKN